VDAGKTTILYKLKLGEVVTSVPTIGEVLFFYQCPISAHFQSSLASNDYDKRR